MQKSRRISATVALGTSVAVLALMAQAGGPNPTCHHCSATYIPVSELNAYTDKAVKYRLVDQQVRSVDVGKVQVGIGMVTRGKLLADPNRKGAVAEHEQVSEVYHAVSYTHLTLPTILLV